MDGPDARHGLFETARRRAGWTIHQLWLHSLGAGSTLSAFDIEAYLHGLVPLTPVQQDRLAIALNDRISDLYQSAVVPYLTTTARPPRNGEDPLAVLDELLRAAGRDGLATPPRRS